MKKFLLLALSMALTVVAYATTGTIEFDVSSSTAPTGWPTSSPNAPSTLTTYSLTSTDGTTYSVNACNIYWAKSTTNCAFAFKKNLDGILELPALADKAITKIDCYLANNTNVSDNITLSVSVDGTSIGSLKMTRKQTSSIDVPEAQQKFGNIVTITNPASNGKSSGISKITIYWTDNLSKLADPELSFPADAYTAQLGGSFEAPNATAKSNGKISYESSKPEVATVNATTGEVSVLSVGETVIKATIAETAEYKAGSASYTLTVVDPKAELAIYSSAMGEDFNFENVEGQTYPWQHSTQYGLKGSAYIGKVIACEGIAFSPVIDLTGYKELSLSFSNAFNNYKVSSQMIPVGEFPGKYAFVVIREEGATEWEVLCEPTAPETFSWTFYDNAPIDLNAYAGKKIQFGFKYVSTADCAGTWEVQGISINGKIDGTPELPTVEIADGYVTGDAGKGNLISYMYEVVSSRALVDAGTWSTPETQTVSLPVSELTANGTRDAYVYFQAVNPLTDDKSPIFANLVSKSGNLTGVEGVEAEGAETPVEYYNLQGVRVENPESGLYIRRQGNKTTKVIL